MGICEMDKYLGDCYFFNRTIYQLFMLIRIVARHGWAAKKIYATKFYKIAILSI